MAVIQSLNSRKVLNSHVKFTLEFIVALEGGASGYGASSQGETISIYEDKKVAIDAGTIIQTITKDGLLGQPLDQAAFDAYLHQRIPQFGRNNTFGLSLAFFNAANQGKTLFESFGRPPARLNPPHLCLNILNGGWHAYTNPVLSDFSEFMLVAKSTNLEEAIAEHNEIQRVVAERLLRQTKTVVSGNPVNCFATADNREPIDFLMNVCESLHLRDRYELMIDASAGDLCADGAYTFAITDHATHSGDEMVDYWQGLIQQYGLRWLEDPFQEKDFSHWQRLTAQQPGAHIIGDNLYSSDAARIAEGAAGCYSDSAVIKPNQAGTVTAVVQAIQPAQAAGIIPITSHRSISTESTFLSALTCAYAVPYIKIGPLLSDYSSVVRLNEIIRLTE
jgi:enolase